MKTTIKDARRLIKSLKKKYNCYCHVMIDFSCHGDGFYEECLKVYVEAATPPHRKFFTTKEARNVLL